ncbi:MAG: hypothetical protein ACI8YQ_003751 [Polaribacter sp.]|jgi:hypothetical protein
MTKRFIPLIVFLTLPFFLLSQGVGVPLQSDSYHIIDRLEIKTGLLNPIYSSIKGYRRGDVADYAIGIDSSDLDLTVKDRNDLYYILKDNNDFLPSFSTEKKTVEDGNKVYVDSSKTFYTLGNGETEKRDYYFETKKPILKYFYRTHANAFELNKKSFYFKVNPLLRGTVGFDQNEDDFLFDNVRGVALRGGIDQKVFFYTEVLESQTRFQTYFNQRVQRDRAVPGASLYKGYNSSIIDSKGAYDYLNAQGYLGFNISKHVGVQLGHGANFIGNGYRSLFLSDFAANYFYLKLNTRVWRFHFQNIFAELNAGSGRDAQGDNLIPKKYFAAHYLNVRITNNLQIGLFESVVFSRQNHFELQYLNPVILYRSVEHLIGSPDNVMIGMDIKWNLFNRFQFYGQMILDEFKFNELIVERNGWWANKYGIQAGLRYIDVFGIDHLDGQLEYNTVRPYTYTHGDSLANYMHYNQPLAHPIGANFRELIAKLRYQATKKLMIEGRLIQMQYGIDNDTTNWGTNILLNYNTREQDFNNETAQGIKTTTQIIGLDISYQVFHNMYIDLNYFYRNQNSEDDAFDLKNNYIGGGIRVNLNRSRKGEF